MQMPKDKPKVRNITKTVYEMVSYAAKRWPWYTLLSFTLLIVAVLIPIVQAWIGGQIIDTLVAQLTTSQGLDDKLIRLIIILLVSLVVGDFVKNLRSITEYNLMEKIRIQMTEDVVRKLAYLDSEYYDTPKINDMINRVQTKHRQAPHQFFYETLIFLEELTKVVSGFVILIGLGPIVILVTLLALLPETVSNMFFIKKTWKVMNELTEMSRDANMTEGILKSETNLQELRIFRLRDYMIGRFKELYENYNAVELKINNKRRLFSSILGIVSIIGHGISMVVIIYKVVYKTITIGQFSFYLSMLNRFENSVYSMFSVSTRLYERGLYVQEIFDFMRLEQKIKNGNVLLEKSANPPAIEFKDVWFKYPGASKYALKEFSLKIHPGEHIAIVGENGAGKTTLIRLLMRFYDVDKGEILINGVKITELDLDTWYALVATLFQEFNFYHFSAKTNIGVGNLDLMENTSQIMNAARSAGAHDFIQRYDNKYDQILSKQFSGGINPSVGQKQKIALARAFFKKSPVLILDEPTSAIDPKSEFEIFEKLLNFAQGKTVIIISHRFSTVRNANRILVIEGGNIIEEGTHEELIALNGKYKHAFELQKRGYE